MLLAVPGREFGLDYGERPFQRLQFKMTRVAEGVYSSSTEFTSSYIRQTSERLFVGDDVEDPIYVGDFRVG